VQRTLAADHGLSGRNVGGSALDTQLEMHDVASLRASALRGRGLPGEPSAEYGALQR